MNTSFNPKKYSDGIRKKTLSGGKIARFVPGAEEKLKNDADEELRLENPIIDIREEINEAVDGRREEKNDDAYERGNWQSSNVRSSDVTEENPESVKPELKENDLKNFFSRKNKQETTSHHTKDFYIVDRNEELLVSSYENKFTKSAKNLLNIKNYLQRGSRIKVLLAGSAFFILFALLSTIFVRANLNLNPKIEDLSLQNIQIQLSAALPSINTSQKTIPSERLQFSDSVSRTFQATGKRSISQKASAKALIYNAFSSLPQGLVVNTRFLSSDGILYRLAKSVIVPGAKVESGKIIPQSVEVTLSADQPGEASNKEGQIKLSIPGFKGTAKYDGFYAVAENGFSGGAVGETTVVSRDDLTQAEQETTKELYNKLSQEIKDKTPEGFTTSDSLNKIQITNVDAPKENFATNQYTVSAQGEGDVIVFRQSDILELLKQIVLGPDSSKNFVDGSAAISYRAQSVDFNKGIAQVLIEGDIKTKDILPTDDILSLVKGQKIGSIEASLKARPDLASFSVSIFPPWIYKAPSDVSKIDLNIH